MPITSNSVLPPLVTLTPMLTSVLTPYLKSANVRVCLYITYIACGSASLYIKTLFFSSVLWHCQRCLCRYIKTRYDAKTPQFAIFGTRVICVFYSIECLNSSCSLFFQTPKDKLQCVLRCSSTIMNLLSMASEKSVPAADDFMPVLIFVLIKANPPSLLSTVQYVNSFYEKRLQGEEQYWWMQFSSAIEFIKTMDYVE